MSKTIPFPIRNSAGDKSVTDLVTIGIDLGDRWSQICVLNANGEILDQSRLKSSPHNFTQRFAALAPARIAMEAGTHSLWAKELLTRVRP